MLHHVIYGAQTNGPPLVFLGGLTQTTAHWTSHGRAFGRDYRVITYDARGQGETPVGDEPLSLPLHAADLVGLMSELDIARAHLCGFSHGARIALQVAASYPERVHRLVLVSATARPSAMASVIVRGWREILDLGGLEAMSWAALPAILGARYLEANIHLLDGILKAAVSRNDEAAVRALLQAMADYPDLTGLAAEVVAPTLVVSASEDPLVTPQGAADLARLCRGRHELLSELGHTIPIEAPQEFRRIVREFLEPVEPHES